MMRALAAMLVILLAACAGSGPRSADMVEASRVNTQLGVDYLRQGNVNEAIEKLERAVDQDPGSAAARTALALAYSQSPDPERAEGQYRRALNLDPEGPEIRNNFGVYLCRKGQMAEAEKLFLEAARNPKYKTPEAAWTNAGVCVVKTNPQKAEGYFRQALERNRNFADALAQMALLCFQQKDYWRARAFMQRHEEAAPASPETLWIGLQIERALGRGSDAARYEQRLKAEFPESEQAANLRNSN